MKLFKKQPTIIYLCLMLLLPDVLYAQGGLDGAIGDEDVQQMQAQKLAQDGAKKEDEEAAKVKSDDEDKDDYALQLGTLANLNFVGKNNFLSNLTPIINMGGILPMVSAGAFSWQLDINPYIGGDIDTKDSAAIIPALMLYGRGGLIVNNYFDFKLNKDGSTRLTLIPIAFALKLLPNLLDSNTIIVQHNLRTGIVLSFKKQVMLGFQYTHGWHNTTSESKENFNRIFNTVTDIDYLTATLQYSPKADQSWHMYFEWRGLLSLDRYTAYTNNSVLTIGVRKDFISIRNAAAGSAKGKKGGGTNGSANNDQNRFFHTF